MVHAEVPLGGTGKVAIIDKEDIELIGSDNWTIKQYRRNEYAVAYLYNEPRLLGGGYPFISMHRLLTGWEYVDHTNGNGLDNRRANLRQATHAQNIQNQRTQKRSHSGYRGVTYFPTCGKWKRRKPWRARIKIDGRDITIGYFETKEEAALAWNEQAILAWGEYANLNQISEERR